MNRPTNTPHLRHRDAGFSLIELVFAIGIIGVLSVVLFGGIAVIFNTEDGVGRTVSESHDLEQLTNYFPADVQAGPYELTGYTTDPSATTGCSGAAAAGSNVVRFDLVDPATATQRRVSYRVVGGADDSVLDRYVCGDGGTGSFGPATSLNIADALSPIDGSDLPVEVEFDEASGVVSLVTMRFTQATGREVEVSASPRAGDGAPLSGWGFCPPNPLDYSHGFLGYILDRIHLNGTQSYGALGAKEFSWGPNSSEFQLSSGRYNTDLTVAPYGDKIALYADSLDFANSSGELRVTGGQSYLTTTQFGTSPFGKYNNGGVGSSQSRFEPNAGSTPYVNQQTARQDVGTFPVQRASNPIDFATDFTALEQISTELSWLPGDCEGATHVVMYASDGSTTPFAAPASGSAVAWVKFELDKANILNISKDELQKISQWHESSTSSVRPGDTPATSLVINITDEGDLGTFNPVLDLQNYPKYVMYNFPNATRIELASGSKMWGTLIAPHAQVVAPDGNDLRGNIVARELTVNGGVIDVGRSFEACFPWDPAC